MPPAASGLPPLDNQRVVSYVGNGAPLLIRRALGERASEAEVQEALEFFLDYYREHALDAPRCILACSKPSIACIAPASVWRCSPTSPPISAGLFLKASAPGAVLPDLRRGQLRFKKPDPIGVEAIMKEAGVEPGEP